MKIGQKYKNIFVVFMVQMKNEKFAFEINWPLTFVNWTLISRLITWNGIQQVINRATIISDILAVCNSSLCFCKEKLFVAAKRILKVAFFQKVRFVFQISKSQKKNIPKNYPELISSGISRVATPCVKVMSQTLPLSREKQPKQERHTNWKNMKN